MRNRSVKILSAVLLTAYGLLAFSSDRVKLIEFSWSSPDTEFLRKHIETMEAGAPYDGIGINLKTTPHLSDASVPAASLARYPHDPDDQIEGRRAVVD